MSKTTRKRIVLSGRLLVMAFLVLAGAVWLSDTARVSAAACAAPGSDLGTDTITINAPAAATYTVWTRMKAPDTTHNSINLQVDDSTCFNVGGGTFTATSWASGSGNWVKYQNGSTANVVSLPLSAGSHTFKYIGTQAGVEVDKIIITSDASCTPTGMGTDCQSGDSGAPTVALQAPTNGQTVGGTVTLKATATDAGGVASVQFLVDGNAVGTDTTAPYEYAWNSATVANGSHTIAAKATDTTGNAATSTAVTVTVQNSTVSPAKCDLNGDKKINLTDLSIMLSNWNKTGAQANQGDVNGDGKVNLTDLSILLSNWGKTV